VIRTARVRQASQALALQRATCNNPFPISDVVASTAPTNADGCAGGKHKLESGCHLQCCCCNACVELTGSMTWPLIWGSQITELRLLEQSFDRQEIEGAPPVTKTARRAAFDNFCVFRRSLPCEAPAKLVNVNKQRQNREECSTTNSKMHTSK